MAYHLLDLYNTTEHNTTQHRSNHITEYHAPPDFMEYFQGIKHYKETRGNEHSLLLPKVKSEAGRKTFAFHPGCNNIQ